MRLNWLAIVVAAVVHWVLGGVWFTVFRAPWQAGTRMSQEELPAYMAHPNFWPYIIALLCNIVLAYVIARVLSAYGNHGLFRGISVGVLVGLAAALAMITEMAFELRLPTFMAIAAGYPLVGCIIMGIIIGVWKPRATGAVSQ